MSTLLFVWNEVRGKRGTEARKSATSESLMDSFLLNGDHNAIGRENQQEGNTNEPRAHWLQ